MARPSAATCPGIKAARGDLILAGALVVDGVMEAGGFDALRGHRGRPARGRLLRAAAMAGRRWSSDVRRDAVRNLAAQYDTDFAHAEHVARLALEMWDALGADGLHPGDPQERELAVGDRDAARHRRRGRLRRPPQALALPDPERRPARLLPARDGPDRPGGALSPQGQPGPRRVRRRSRAKATGRCSTASRPRSASPSSSSARATSRSAPATSRSRAGRAAPAGLRRRPIARWAAERQGDLFRRAFDRDLNVT